MEKNSVLNELDKKANVDDAKRDLVLRFIRDQESLQTSQVDLKLIDDNTIDLIDSATNDELINDGVSGIRLEDGRPLHNRPPSARPKSRRLHRPASNETSTNIRKLSLSKAQSSGGDIVAKNAEKMDRALLQSASGKDRLARTMSPHEMTNLNSSWPEHEFLSRKLTSRKYLLCTPEKRLENVDGRPFSSLSTRQQTGGLDSRSTSPTKKHSSKNRNRTFMNLNIEPVHPSEIPLLRGRSASSSVSGPLTMVHLPPIQNTAPSM